MSARPPFRIHQGIVAPLLRSHIDTDQIVPRQFLKRLERSGFGQFLFHEWRQGSDSQPAADFVLNRPVFVGASILVTGPNFGCGSSREHAAWALADYGFKVILAPAFADIFFANAVVNGLLPATIDEQVAEDLAALAEAQAPFTLTVDLTARRLHADGFEAPFGIDAVARERLLDGRDEIDRILEHEPAIAAYEQQRVAERPAWWR